MIKKVAEKYGYLMLFGCIVLLLPLNWYEVPYMSNTLEYGKMGISGWDVLSQNMCIGFALFLLSLSIQHIVNKERKYYLIAICSQVINVMFATIYPILILKGGNKVEGIYLYKSFWHLVSESHIKYELGFFLGIIVLIISIILNVVALKRVRKK